MCCISLVFVLFCFFQPDMLYLQGYFLTLRVPTCGAILNGHGSNCASNLQHSQASLTALCCSELQSCCPSQRHCPCSQLCLSRHQHFSGFMASWLKELNWQKTNPQGEVLVELVCITFQPYQQSNPADCSLIWV